MVPPRRRISGAYQNDIRSRLKRYLCIIVTVSFCAYLIATPGSNKHKNDQSGVRNAETASESTGEKNQLRVEKSEREWEDGSGEYAGEGSPDDDKTGFEQEGEDNNTDDEGSIADDDDDGENPVKAGAVGDSVDDLASKSDANDESIGSITLGGGEKKNSDDGEIEVEEVKDAVEEADGEIEDAEEGVLVNELEKLYDAEDDVESTMEQVVEEVLVNRSMPVAEIASVEMEVAERLEDEIEDNLKTAAKKILKEQEAKMKKMAIGDTKDSMANVDIKKDVKFMEENLIEDLEDGIKEVATDLIEKMDRTVEKIAKEVIEEHGFSVTYEELKEAKEHVKEIKVTNTDVNNDEENFDDFDEEDDEENYDDEEDDEENYDDEDDDSEYMEELANGVERIDEEMDDEPDE
mmetsp:Transcript_31171/g.38055  ORF Transcript_31171/g.38055 Transcript_31171/m.38055 type:complete len:406 (+) Transcript_31171:91-1308(+)